MVKLMLGLGPYLPMQMTFRAPERIDAMLEMLRIYAM